MALSLAACGGGSPASAPAALPSAPIATNAVSPGKYIKHVVIVVQENRSFENMFAGWYGARAPMSGYTHTGQLVPLHQVTYFAHDISHDYQIATQDIDHGKMDGFDLNTLPISTYAYAYLDHAEIGPYREMARDYVLADRMFSTELGESFTAHLELIAGNVNLTPTLAEVNTPDADPWGCGAPAGTTTQTIDSSGQISYDGPFPCFTEFRTMADTLDAAHVSWKYYAPAANVLGYIWSSFQAIKSVRYGKDWAKVISPQTTVLTDAASGKLASVDWVIPDAFDSDHPAVKSDTGPSWVGAVVDAIGKSPAWSSTAIVVLWDDWGGWYDSEPPPNYGVLGLGLRVPCIVISPYAKRGYVDDTQYEFGSILKFVEEVYGLPTLGPESAGYTDGRATSLENAFDFSQKPRAFKPIPVVYPPDYFLHRPPSLMPPDND